MKNVYNGYTGYGKGLRELGDYINNNNLSKEKMTGDTNGIYAYVNNPLSFYRYTKPFKICNTHIWMTNYIILLVKTSKIKSISY